MIQVESEFIDHSFNILRQVLRELVSTREASMGVRKLCVRGGLSYISMGGQYQDYTDTP